MNQRTLIGLLMCAACCGLAWSPASAQVIEEVFPLEPEDGATVGARPILRVGVDGDDIHLMKFRVEMSLDGFDTFSHVFDQKEDTAGWAFAVLGDEQGALLRVPKPLSNGVHEWRVSAWNGVEWIEGDSVYELEVDGINPAEVDTLRMDWADNGGLKLVWDPITTDMDGRPEYISRYHVYRYDRASYFFSIRAFEIGTTEETEFVDDSEMGLKSGLLFYKVTGEDAAGNHDLRRY
ncbi:hypothetical protein ABI59_03265 [Acidobacteria bacterium Mor1]|nr:hypothetical protein ABI59_03265 [Acidobacteria bacterium Mor1]